MHRLVSAIVLSIALSVATGNWLDHWGRFLACSTIHETASHGTSGWSDRARQTPTPIVEALPGATISVDRSAVIVRGLAAPSHAGRVSVLRTRTARPHDPPHLHTFALLI
jgi:hypothetical protein